MPHATACVVWRFTEAIVKLESNPPSHEELRAPYHAAGVKEQGGLGVVGDVEASHHLVAADDVVELAQPEQATARLDGEHTLSSQL